MLHTSRSEHDILLRRALKHHPTDWLTVVEVLLLRPDLVSLRQRYRKFTPLHSAVVDSKPDYVSLLLFLGGDANAKDAFGFTPLATAANADVECVEVVRILLCNKNVNPFSLCGSKGSPLHAAAMRGHHSICKMLTAAAGKNSDVLHCKDWRGCTALDIAKEQGHDSIARLIEESSRSVQAGESEGVQ